jgi:hypothetical protein
MADVRPIFGPRLPKKDGFVLIGGELPKLIMLRLQLLDLTFGRKFGRNHQPQRSSNALDDFFV